jgi:hypothetical protein
MTDYGIFLTGQRISEEKEDSDSDDKPTIKYRIKIEKIDSIINLATNRDVKFEKGKSPSQIMRFRIERELGEYVPFMKWLAGKLDSLIQEYKEL